MPSVLAKAKGIFAKKGESSTSPAAEPVVDDVTPELDDNAAAGPSNARNVSASASDEEDQASEGAPNASRRGSVVAEVTSSPLYSSTAKGKLRLERVPSGGRVEFFRQDQPFYWLSNSSDYPVVLDGLKYPTAEHLFQASKFLGHKPEIAAKVRKAPTPSEALKEARRNAADVRKGWIKAGTNVQTMREVLFLKFSQHSDLRRALLQTGDAEIESASPTDAFWGTAKASGVAGQGLGRNELGKALVRTRETLRSVSGLGLGSGAITV